MARTLAIIPARGGSKGLPGKNIRPLCGLPLIVHSIKCAKMSPGIARAIVSTDSVEIAAVAKQNGGDVPFLRPAELASDKTPIWPAFKHALAEIEKSEGGPYDFVAVLDPTSPTRVPDDIAQALDRLEKDKSAVGIVAVSEPDFSPIWHTVVEKDGAMHDFLDGSKYNRRQDVPTIYRINGLLYIWRAEYVRTRDSWRDQGRHLMHITPDSRASSIDTLEQFERLEALIKAGLIELPWLP